MASFYSLVSSLKDKSSQAMATLSSDLQEFKTIMQEDVAEVAKTMRKSVQDTSEALQRRGSVESASAKDSKDEHNTLALDDDDDDDDDGKHEEKASPSPADAFVEPTATAREKDRRGEVGDTSLTSMFGFGGFSLEAVGTSFLNQADQLLGALAGEEEGGQHPSAETSEQRYRLLALQEDPETYIEPPTDTETFERWREALTVEELKDVRAEIMEHHPIVSERRAELVPDAVSEDDFWAHYIYKASLLAAQEKRGADLLEDALKDDEEEIGWDVESPRNAGLDHQMAAPMFQEDADADTSNPVGKPHEEQRPLSGPGPIETMSSDGESWIELEEHQRRGQMTPESSISTDSGPPSVLKSNDESTFERTAQEVLDDEEEEVDWGDDDETEGEVAAAMNLHIPDSSEATAGKDGHVSEDIAPSKKRGEDWGEWD